MKSLLPLALGLSLSAVASAQYQAAHSDTTATTSAGVAAATISEIRIDQSGGDNDEFFELTGPAGLDLSNYTYLVIGDGSGAGAGGGLDAVVPLSGVIPPSGYFLVAEGSFSLATADLVATLNFENSDNVTHLLVEGWTGTPGLDLDVDDDGVIDSPAPWTALLDQIAIVEDFNSGELIYGLSTVGPDGSFVPGHVYTCGGAWAIGQFSPLGATDTPGYDGCGTPIISSFCAPVLPNSTGVPAELVGNFGSGNESGLHLEASNGPPNQFGYFLGGTGVDATPIMLSDGNLCLSSTGGNFFSRYNVAGTPMNSAGAFDINGDFQNLVGTPGGSGYDVATDLPSGGIISAGQTWHFQLWYRDGPGSSNLTNGISALFL